jgi:hypothetical protein
MSYNRICSSKRGWGGSFLGKRFLGTDDKRQVEINYTSNLKVGRDYETKGS